MGFTDFVSNATYDLYEAKLEKEVLEGQMPKHVAIIMDGNRRYAKDVLKTDDTSEGHRRGKDKVEEVLNWLTVRPGDVLGIRFGEQYHEYEIVSIAEHAAKQDASSMYKAKT